MSAGFALFMIYWLVPLAVILIALFGRPLLELPARARPGLSAEAAYERSLTVLVLASGVVELIALAYFARLGPFAG